MDKQTLIIVIITAVVSAIAKELTSWFVRRAAKITATVATTVKEALIKHARILDIVVAGVVVISFFGNAFWISQSDKPITGGGVFAIASLTGLGFWYLREFEHKLLAYARDKSL
jgi:cytochrome oxidase assembly protein ShyY1